MRPEAASGARQCGGLLRNRSLKAAKDANGIPRCYGIDRTEQKAETQARWAVKEYVRHRREMRFEDFTFETEILAS